MKNLIKRLTAMDPNQRNYWLGLLLLFVGLAGLTSLFMAFTVTGAVMIVEGVITSYIVAVLNSKVTDANH